MRTRISQRHATTERPAGGEISAAADDRDRVNALPAIRDELVQFTLDRLRAAAAWQGAERVLTVRGASWSFRQAVQRGAALPEPTRWSDVARAWDAVLAALCAGDVGRAAALIDVALQVEDDVRAATTTALSTVNLPPAADPPSGLDQLRPGDATSGVPIPTGGELASAIQSVTVEVPDVPARARGRDPWWTVEEFEDDGPP